MKPGTRLAQKKLTDGSYLNPHSPPVPGSSSRSSCRSRVPINRPVLERILSAWSRPRVRRRTARAPRGRRSVRPPYMGGFNDVGLRSQNLAHPTLRYSALSGRRAAHCSRNLSMTAQFLYNSTAPRLSLSTAAPVLLEQAENERVGE